MSWSSELIGLGLGKRLSNKLQTWLSKIKQPPCCDDTCNEIEFNDGIRIRYTINDSKCELVSPDGNEILKVENGSINLSSNTINRISINDTYVRLEPPDGDGYLGLKNDLFEYRDGTKQRIAAGTDNTRIVSPDGLKKVRVSNNGTVVVGYIKADDFYSGDGTQGATGTITLSSVTTITVKDGLITGWS